jgi:hypothetical protein
VVAVGGVSLRVVVEMQWQVIVVLPLVTATATPTNCIASTSVGKECFFNLPQHTLAGSCLASLLRLLLSLPPSTGTIGTLVSSTILAVTY